MKTNTRIMAMLDEIKYLIEYAEADIDHSKDSKVSKAQIDDDKARKRNLEKAYEFLKKSMR